MTVYPMARGTLVNFAAFRARYEMENTRLDAGSPMVTNVSKEEFRKDFEGWEDEVKALIDVSPFSRCRYPVSTSFYPQLTTTHFLPPQDRAMCVVY